MRGAAQTCMTLDDMLPTEGRDSTLNCIIRSFPLTRLAPFSRRVASAPISLYTCWALKVRMYIARQRWADPIEPRRNPKPSLSLARRLFSCYIAHLKLAVERNLRMHSSTCTCTYVCLTESASRKK